MTATPRALFVLAIVTLAIIPLPQAAAGDCVEVNTTTFSEGLRVIANAGRQLALGIRSGEPGDGIGFVLIITPAVCSGFGIGGLSSDSISVQDLKEQLTSATEDQTFLPLP